MTEQLIPVSIVIGDRTYRIKIHPRDEEVVRKTVKTINDKIVEFRTHFAGKDMQDYIAMVLAWYATLPDKTSAGNFEKDTIHDGLNMLEKMLDNHLA